MRRELGESQAERVAQTATDRRNLIWVMPAQGDAARLHAFGDAGIRAGVPFFMRSRPREEDTRMATGGEPLLDVRSITLRYRDVAGGTLEVLRDVSLHVKVGEFVALIGPSGSGKTTLLSLIAGLETPTSGEIALDGDPNAPRLGHVGYMPQRDLLLPWRSALDNAAAGLEVRGVAKDEARERAWELF